MALPNSYYSWIYQLLWGLKHFFVELGTAEVLFKSVENKWKDDIYYTLFDGSNGPYLITRLWYTGNVVDALNGNKVKIVVDDELFWDDVVVSALDTWYIGRNSTKQPFVLARKKLKISHKARWPSNGGRVHANIMRFSE